MSLKDTLKQISENNAKRIPADKLAILNRANDTLRESGIMDEAIQVDEKLPSFALKNQDGEIIRSEELLAKGPLVISFFRGVWCGYCNAELKALGEAQADIEAAGATLVVISPQTAEGAAKTRRTNKLEADVLIDEGNDYAELLGLRFRLEEEIEELYKGFGIILPMANGDDSWTLPMPARLVVDRHGRIVYAAIDPDYTTRPEPSETLAAIPAKAAA